MLNWFMILLLLSDVAKIWEFVNRFDWSLNVKKDLHLNLISLNLLFERRLPNIGSKLVVERN